VTYTATKARVALAHLAAASLLALTPSTVFAQDAASGDASAEAGAAEEEALDPSDPLYWSKLRGIETIQKRQHQKVGRFALTLNAGFIPNNIFEQYFPVGLRLNYFILENIGVELSSNFAIGRDTGLIDTLQDPNGVAAQGVLLGDRQISHTNVGIVWSPISGKTSFLNQSLNYFDFYLFGGFGLLVKQTESDFGVEPTIAVTPEGALGAGMLFFFTDNLGARLDFRQYIFQKVTGGVSNPSEVTIGFTYML
jgi:outer membrane beta-barrel protein